MKWASIFVVPFALVVLVCYATSTPSPASWHRNTLIGEDESSYYRYATQSLHPGTYYSFRQVLSLQRISMADFSILEEIPLRDVKYVLDLDTNLWRTEEADVPPFNLPDYLRSHAVFMAFAVDDLPDLRIDESGVYLEKEGLREIVMAQKDVLAQIPGLGREPRIVVLQETRKPRRDGQVRSQFYTVYSNSASLDDDWSEDLLVVQHSAIATAGRKLSKRLAK